MRFLRRALVGIFLMSLTIALLGYAGSTVYNAVQARMNEEPRSFPARERVISVNVVTVNSGQVTPEMTVFGELRSARTLDLRAAVGGTVVEVSPALAEGGIVTAGQLLLRIDPVEAEAALARVQADLQDAEAERRDAERALLIAQDELAAAQAQADLRAQALARQADLVDRGIGAVTALETAELAASSADQAVLSRRQALAQAETRRDQTETTLARMAISLAEAERTLAETSVFAAFDGTLTEVTATLGGRLTANERIGQLVDPALLEVSFRVSTAQYGNLIGPDGRLLHAPVRASLDVSGVSLTATGTISREGAVVGAGQTGRLIFATLDTAPGLRPGDFVTVSIAEPALENVAILPATAVAADQSVLVLGEGDRLRLEPVTLLRRQGNDVIVQADHLNGQSIVAERSPLLGSGILVRLIIPGGTAEAPVPGDISEAPFPGSISEAPVPGDTAEAPVAEMIALTEDRRARLVAFIQSSDQMPDEAKARLLAQLEQDEVAADVVARLESRMGS